MHRIHFTAADLAGVRVSAGWGEFAETVFAVDALKNGRPAAMFGGWRSSLRSKNGQTARTARLLSELLPNAHSFDLITVVGRNDGFEHAADRLMGASRRHVKIELDWTAEKFSRPPSWAWGLCERNGQTRAQVASAIAACHERAVKPHWRGIAARLEAERARLARELAQHGLGKVLATLHPAIRWRPPTLEVDFRGPNLECHLEGRGLLIVPSVFCPAGRPGTLDPMNPADPLVLFYPVLRDPADALDVWRQSDAGADRALTALLGRTRATILRAIGDGPLTTTELAGRTGVSIPSASQHATTLREASLITTRRHAGAVLHTLTPLGEDLLNR